uniref:Uncharacterized protein n=1 Tax=Arundo donax TaxID=35708 RepID=A0A0A9DB57_ARUDO
MMSSLPLHLRHQSPQRVHRCLYVHCHSMVQMQTLKSPLKALQQNLMCLLSQLRREHHQINPDLLFLNYEAYRFRVHDPCCSQTNQLGLCHVHSLNIFLLAQMDC